MLKFYVATIFLLHGLAPMPGIAFGFIVAATTLVFAVPMGRLARHTTRLRLDDGLFGAVFLLGLVPLALAPARVGLQNLLYAGLWLATWTVCFWWVREWALAIRVDFVELSKAASIGAMVLGVSVLLEFILANTAGLYLSDFVRFSIDEFPLANVLGDELRRPRGFTAEAGFSAIVFECLLPLSIAWLRKGKGRLWLFIAIVLPAYVLLFSAASMMLLLITLLVFMGLNGGWARSFRLGLGIAALVGLVAITSDDASWLLYEVVARKLLEFAPDEVVGAASTFSRPEAYALAYTIMTKQPLGIGWGGVSQAMASALQLFGSELRGSGLISIPLEIGASAGIAGMLAYVTIVWRKLARLVKIDSLEARLVFVSLMWVTLHHAVVLEFWFPMIWLSLALADVVVVRAAGQPACGWNRAKGIPKRRPALVRGSA
jgi:hypothetical protein